MAKRKSIKRLVVLCGVLLIAAAAAFGFQKLRRSTAEEYRTFASPDGRFEIVVYRIPMSFALPGQGSDAPGFFQLRDVRTGRVLHERRLEMVQLVDQIHWSLTNVNVRLLADWSLPQ